MDGRHRRGYRCRRHFGIHPAWRASPKLRSPGSGHGALSRACRKGGGGREWQDGIIVGCLIAIQARGKRLSRVVFTITEIPVPLIREIVAEMLAGGDGGTIANVTPAANVVPITRPEAEPRAERFDAFAKAAEPEVTPAAATPTKKPKAKPAATAAKVGNPGHGDDHWTKVRAYWEKCRSINKTAEKFGLSPNTVKTRARRENWKQGVTA